MYCQYTMPFFYNDVDESSIYYSFMADMKSCYSSLLTPSFFICFHRILDGLSEKNAKIRFTRKRGLLDEQFIQLEELQDDANPNFVEEVVTLYYRDSSRIILNIEQSLERNPLDFNKLDNYMHQFKGSSTSIGAKKVKAECTQFREYCRAGNGEGCMRTFQQLKKEYAILKRKLENYFQQSRQAGPSETACRPRMN
ncbi:hypothetical protein I3760_01G228200 [Carya illinoinensis]|nr:hypothetical protein I3760_01G228200 [Carya illinoinensis]